MKRHTKGEPQNGVSDAKKLEATGLTETTNKLLMAKIQPKIWIWCEYCTFEHLAGQNQPKGSRKTPPYSPIYVSSKTQHFSPASNRDSLVEHVDLQYLMTFSPCELDCYKTFPRSSSNLSDKLQSLKVVQRNVSAIS